MVSVAEVVSSVLTDSVPAESGASSDKEPSRTVGNSEQAPRILRSHIPLELVPPNIELGVTGALTSDQAADSLSVSKMDASIDVG
jgi:hypothetical protein